MKGIESMKGKLLEYGNESNVQYEDIEILDVKEKNRGFKEFEIQCRIYDAYHTPNGRYTVELDDGRRGTVIIISIKYLSNQLEVILKGEGSLK